MSLKRLLIALALFTLAFAVTAHAEQAAQELTELYIVTEGGKEPACEAVYPPDDRLLGTTIKNNDYVKGTLTVIAPGGNKTVCSMKIKVRGNTSALAGEKKPYKIKLSSPADLIDPEGNNLLREWVLLTDATDLRTYMGFYLGRLLNTEWQTPVRFVSVNLNGDFRGCYLLVPAVTREAAGELVSEDGFIFEDDAYWWDTDIYFKLSRQLYQMGYTFKYPDFTSRADSKLKWIKARMQKIEDLLYSGSEEYTGYFDAESAARWLLVRDIMADVDGAGANMYFYKYDATNRTKVKMGPLWDFTGSFLGSAPAWSGAHTGGAFWFDELMLSPAFYDSYTGIWSDLYPTLIDEITSELDRLAREEGAAIDECLRRDAARWGREYSNFETEKSEIIALISAQAAWMNEQITTTLGRKNCIDVSGYETVRGNLNYYIDADSVHGDRRRVVGWAYCLDGYTAGITGLLSGDTLYTGETVCRPDVKQVFSLSTDMHGFIVIAQSGAECVVCIADTENRILYIY